MKSLTSFFLFIAGASVGVCILYVAARLGGHRSFLQFPKNAGCVSIAIAIFGAFTAPFCLAELLVAMGVFTLRENRWYQSYDPFRQGGEGLTWTVIVVLLALCGMIVYFLWITSEEYTTQKAAEDAAREADLRRREEEAAIQRRKEQRVAESVQDMQEAGRRKLRAYLTDMRRAIREINGTDTDAIGIEMIESAVDGILTDADITQAHLYEGAIQTDMQLILRLLSEKGYGNDVAIERIREHLLKK